jgi:16S rRNA processing protein RimM
MEEAAPAQSDDDVVVGRIVGAWGLRGEVKVQSHTDNPERLSAGSRVYLSKRPAMIERSAGTKAGLRLKLDLASDRTQAEELRGLLLTVPRTEVAPLPDGSYYHFQIIDMDVVSEDGELMGKVAEILTTGSNDVYVVRASGSKDILVPAIAGVVLKIDLDQNEMVVRIPQGLT